MKDVTKVEKIGDLLAEGKLSVMKVANEVSLSRPSINDLKNKKVVVEDMKYKNVMSLANYYDNYIAEQQKIRRKQNNKFEKNR